MQIERGEIQVTYGKKIFIVKVVVQWQGLSREVADSPTLAMFRHSLDGALRLELDGL